MSAVAFDMILLCCDSVVCCSSELLTVSTAPAASPGGRCVPGVLIGWASSRVVFQGVLLPLPLLGFFDGSGSILRGEQGRESRIDVVVRG